MLSTQIFQKKHIMALVHTKPKKLAYENDEYIYASNGKHTSGIGKVSQSVVESSNGTTISLNGYHSQQV